MTGVAIVGMACVLPGAPDAGVFWDNVVGGVDATSEVPPDRWDPVFYDPESTAPDRFYCRRGGFVDEYATFDPLAFGIMPAAAEGAEPDQLLTLQAATRALADAGYDSREFPRERTGIVLGRGNYLGAGITRLIEHVRHGQQVVELLRTLLPDLGEDDLERVKAAFQAGAGTYGPDTAIGLVPNLTASRISNRLDLGGPAYTVDAACASSLVALDHACRDLLDGTVDMAVAGGVHLTHDPSFWSIFCQLGALSRRGEIRPFDRGADGLLIGEGIALVVLKRLADAERDDDRVYAVVRGTGIASDGRHTSLMTPRVDGQLLSLRRAWARAGLDPAAVGLVEAHGTATPAGDAAELDTLARFFGPPNGHRAGLGSVKSMIGHTMPAAGAAGLVKTALALYHGVLPPTLHAEEPHERLAETRFRLVTEAEPWDDRHRLAGVNAFGFGGINAHAVLERHGGGPARRRVRSADWQEDVLVLTAATQQELLAALDGAASEPGPWRLAVVDPTPERLAVARTAVESGRPRRGRDGISFAHDGLVADGGLVAFVFPGVEPGFEPRLDGLEDAPAVDTAEDLERRGLAVIQVGRALQRAAARLGLEPDVIAGHSIGEWNGMVAAGMVGEADVDPFIAALDPGSLEVPGVVFAALGCGAERAAAAAAGLDGVVVSHDNCVHQSLISGPEEAVAAAVAALRGQGVFAEVLPFPHGGFHSSALAPYVEAHRRNYELLTLRPARIPLWSSTTCAPYPDDADAIKALAIEHLLRPVRFRELVLALYEHGVRVFVQLGTGSTPSFVSDTLGRRPHLAISANVPQRSGLEQLRRVAAALFVEGADVRLDAVGLAPRGAVRAPMRLALGVPLIRVETPALRTTRASSPAGGALAAEFDATLRLLDEVQEDVRRALEAGAPPAPRETVDELVLSVDTHPELVDHCLFPQPAGWPDLADRYPVVPMTMSVRLFLDAARRAAPGRVPVGLRDLRALRWLAVEPQLGVTLRTRFDGRSEVAAALDGYIDATVVTEAAYPEPPRAALQLAGERRPPVTAEQLYREGWMFHGPAYQAVVDIAAVSPDGIRGTLRALPAAGALLDGAGQLFGHWMMITAGADKLLMPLRLERLDLYGPEPEPGSLVECTVVVSNVSAREVRAEMELVHDGRLYARVTGWEDVRFRTDDRTWDVMMRPGRGMLSEPDPDGFGFVLFDRGVARFPSSDYLARRYLSRREREELDALPPRRRAEWLGGRVAIKDAVRDLLWRRGHGPLYPVHVTVSNDAGGRPLVSGDFSEDVRVSVAHKGERAVAAARIGVDVGIDLERVELRGAGFVQLAFTDEELALLPDENRDEWLTRLWCAKEAVGKARGTGLAGAPRALVATAFDGDRTVVAGIPVRTRSADGHVIAWTEGEQSA